jgi:hypothetical protein
MVDFMEPASWPAKRGERRLMRRPQRFGIIPTWWFWRELRWDRPLLCGLISLGVGALTLALGWLMIAAGYNLPAVLLTASLGPIVGLGVVERLLRRLVVQRRQALAAGTAELRELAEPGHSQRHPRRARWLRTQRVRARHAKAHMRHRAPVARHLSPRHTRVESGRSIKMAGKKMLDAPGRLG